MNKFDVISIGDTTPDVFLELDNRFQKGGKNGIITLNYEMLSVDLHQISERKCDRIFYCSQRLREKIMAHLQLKFGAKT